MYEPEGDTLDEQVKQYATDLGNFFSGIKAGGQWTRNVNGQTISCSVVTTQEPKILWIRTSTATLVLIITFLLNERLAAKQRLGLSSTGC